MERDSMVELIRARGIVDDRVLHAISNVRRHAFIPSEYRDIADSYGDHPCPIGHGQTISQPYIVAYMSAAIAVGLGDRILEIGTGSGYQAAILAELGAEVYSIEIVPELAAHARAALQSEGYGNVRIKTGDGYKGWPEHAPYDAVIVTCAPHDVPPALVEQLADKGRLIVPVGSFTQDLILFEKVDGRLQRLAEIPVRFVPMVRVQDS
jgi:protein-L-isoaspartate(D-aspartate) O-methyltransferase